MKMSQRSSSPDLNRKVCKRFDMNLVRSKQIYALECHYPKRVVFTFLLMKHWLNAFLACVFYCTSTLHT